MKPFFYHKFKAKQALRGRFGKAAIVTVFMLFLTFVINIYLTEVLKSNYTLNIITELIVTALVLIPFNMGKTVFFMSFLNPEEKVSVGSVLDGYKYIIKLIPYTVIELMLTLFTYFMLLQMPDISDVSKLSQSSAFLMLTVSLIAAVIKIFTSFTFYILCEDRKISGIKALIKSIKLTALNFFYILGLTLSFFLWYLLLVLTSGIIMLYLIPYTELTLIMLYKDITEEGEKKESSQG